VSDIYVFICTKTTADYVMPSSGVNQVEFNRKVRGAFAGMVGGVMQVGDLKLRPNQNSIANHLLCDGATITRAQFPQLVEFLAGSGAASAVLPNYAGALNMPTPTVTQTTTESTVSSGETVTNAGTVGGTTGGNVLSGGRADRDYR
jgi:hypothetical protein